MNPIIALLGLSGAELILILIVLLLLLISPLAIAAVVFVIVRNSRKSAGAAPAIAPPPVMPRQCPQCGASLSMAAPEGLCPACLLAHGIATDAPPAGQPPFTPPAFEDLAKLFPQLEILELIGKGGMGAVYKARQPALERFVALKILAPRSGSDTDFASRFNREARALAKLSHPNIVGVYDFGHVNGLNYFLMEYVDGPNLRQAGKLKPAEALSIIPQICAALQFAHEEGIVHRDIKPENVLLDKKGRVKIADFGLAKIVGQGDFRLTGARDVMGTPHYMAPEQVEHPQDVDHRADIYSLGVVFYEMLTGELPLGKFQPPSQKVQVDVRLDEVILRALAKEPERRYQQASEVKTQVETIVNHPAASGAQPVESLPKLSRPQSVILTVIDIALAALLLLVGAVAYRTGTFFNTLYIFIMLMTPLLIAQIGWRVFNGSLEYRLWRKPFAPELRRYRWQVLNRWTFWLLTAWTLNVCIVPAQFPPHVYTWLMRVIWAVVLLLMLLALLPGKRIYLATNLAFAIGSIFIVVQMTRAFWPVNESDGVVLAAPFRGDWLVLHGGRSALINPHQTVANQRDALDLERVVNGREKTDDLGNLSSYPSWNETLYAPADGSVVGIVDQFADHPPDQTDYNHPAGNHLVIALNNGLYVLMAHLQKGSVLVQPGDVVHAGQPVAKCGNSGNTSHPHLHLQVQNRPEFDGWGVRTYPILFRDIVCLRGGKPRGRAPFFVRRNDLISFKPARDGMVIADGLVSCWSAEDNADDATGNNDGVLVSGAGFAAGYTGRAFNFTGGGQKVVVRDNASLKLTNSLTIEAWVCARGPGFVLMRGDSRGGLDPYQLAVDADGYLAFSIDSSANQRASVRSRMPLNQWEHVAGVFDSAAGRMKLFINGDPVAEQATILRPFAELDPRFEPGLGIGGHPGSDNLFPFDGMIDELSLYSRALNDDEVRAHYHNIGVPNPPVR